MTMNPSSLETRLSGTPGARFWQELLGNSLHFPLANILLEMLIEDPFSYFWRSDLYSLLAGAIVQAYALSRWQVFGQTRRLMGNLIGPAIYTALGLAFEGPEFLQAPNHIAYWVFGLLFGFLQSARQAWRGWFFRLGLLIEDLARSFIVIAMYFIFDLRNDPTQATSLPVFLAEPVHLFVILASLLLGLNAGFAHLTAHDRLNLLNEAMLRLKTYSEWLLGRMHDNPAMLQPKRQERTILFMDMRGFTRWSETRNPEEVVNLLNRYYQTAEATLNLHHVIQFKLSADEVMAIFPKVDDGLQAALKLRPQISALLGRHGLGVGIGLHIGPLVEGLLGSKDVKAYDVIGDTVNTAKRIESSAGPGELLVSEALRIALGATFRAGPKRQITIQGKEEPIVIYPLE